jgi:tetratricopeptide (TPR) repeat protein
MFGKTRPQAASLVRPISDYESLIEQDPTRADAHAALGAALVELNRFEEAKGPLTRACELRPDRPEYRIALSAALAGNGAPDQALAELLGSGRPARGWKQALAGAIVSFGVGVLVLAAVEDPAVAASLLVAVGAIGSSFAWLRRRWRRRRHRGEMPVPAGPDPSTRILSLTVALVAVALIALPAVVQIEFDRLQSPWNYVVLGAYVALGLCGMRVGRLRRRRNHGGEEPAVRPLRPPAPREPADRPLRPPAPQEPAVGCR